MTFHTFKARTLAAAAALALMACAAPAIAAVATLPDFEDIPSGTTFGAGDTFISGGFQFRLDHCCAKVSRFLDNPADDNGTNQLLFTDDQPYEGFGGSLMHITRAGGGLFDLNEFRAHLADGTDYSDSNTDYAEFLGYRDGTYVDGASLAMTHDQSGFFAIGLFGVDEVVVTPLYYEHGGWFAVDSFDIGSGGGGGGGGVPEPASWALMIAGFGGAGAMLRRRRTAPA